MSFFFHRRFNLTRNTTTAYRTISASLLRQRGISIHIAGSSHHTTLKPRHCRLPQNRRRNHPQISISTSSRRSISDRQSSLDDESLDDDSLDDEFIGDEVRDDFFDKEIECNRQRLDAFNGRIPPEGLASLGLPYVIHGIRHHVDFAKSRPVADLCNPSELWAELFTRARNARLIMSNTIPEMQAPRTKPYCIWFPEVATEETYRELARCYPDMRYHVGRACAVAGYNTLYRELDLLPDISIAEEARDNGHTEIFESIIRQETRYAVMDDYTRTVNLESPKPGFLNGDTAVRSTLISTLVEHPYEVDFDDLSAWNIFKFMSNHYFDIQEDEHVAPSSLHNRQITTLEPEFVDLLWKPLPRDLPTINKDPLIIAAAWDGNIDRYERLRRPKLVPNEITAVVRGAYHHTPFARWLDTCLDDIYKTYEWRYVRQAVNARFIMNNNLSHVTTDTDGQDLPAMFWWPHMPHENTLREFAWRRPDFKHQITLACIVGNYQELFDELQCQVKPSQWQWQVACQSLNPHYRHTVKRRAAEEKLELFGEPKAFTTSGYDRNLVRLYLRFNMDPSSREFAYMPKSIRNIPDGEGYGLDSWEDAQGDPLNEHMQLQMAKWATFISQMDGARAPEGMLYSSSADFERRKSPGPEPKKIKDFSSRDDE